MSTDVERSLSFSSSEDDDGFHLIKTPVNVAVAGAGPGAGDVEGDVLPGSSPPDHDSEREEITNGENYATNSSTFEGDPKETPASSAGSVDDLIAEENNLVKDAETEPNNLGKDAEANNLVKDAEMVADNIVKDAEANNLDKDAEANNLGKDAEANNLGKDAEMVADNIVKDAEAFANDLIKDAEAVADNLVKDAETKADNLVQEAEAKKNNLFLEAEAKVNNLVKEVEAKAEASKLKKKKTMDNLKEKLKLMLRDTLLAVLFMQVLLLTISIFDEISHSKAPIGYEVKSFTISSIHPNKWFRIPPLDLTTSSELTFQVKNHLLRDNIRYDPIEITLTHNGTFFSNTTLKQIVVPPSFSSKVKADMKFMIPTSIFKQIISSKYTTASFDLSLKTKIEEHKREKWSNTLVFSCNGIKLGFPAGFLSDDASPAKMVNEEPVVCQCTVNPPRNVKTMPLMPNIFNSLLN